MKHIAAVALFTALFATPAFAACPGGMTSDGKCVNPKLARSMREGVIAFSQPKFSYSAPARLPSEDADAPNIPVQWHELYNLYTQPPLSSVSGPRGGGPDRP
ncbi:MAG TPA: hypothetical protein VHL34_00380 [Rhizomicrobium sp.]|jgi:hypothetical protein|nr:hypothetical protein [Rhizomicrobium sp.]